MSDKPCLSLVPIDDLMREIEKRCTEIICAYCPIDFEKDNEMKFFYGKGNWHKACALASILNNDVLNNWNGELTTLQELNDER